MQNGTVDPLGWKFWAEIDPAQTTPLSFNYSSFGQNVQIRVLQLEHGGGECNCWSMEWKETELCYSSHNHSYGLNDNMQSATYCDGNSSTARGLILQTAGRFETENAMEQEWNWNETTAYEVVSYV